MWQKILGFVVQVLPVIPSLVTDIERLFANQPQSGVAKAKAVESAIAGSIQDVAAEVAKLAPAGTKPEAIATALSQFTADVNSAFVTLCNDLALFPHAGQPATNAVPAPAPSTTVKAS